MDNTHPLARYRHYQNISRIFFSFDSNIIIFSATGQCPILSAPLISRGRHTSATPARFDHELNYAAASFGDDAYVSALLIASLRPIRRIFRVSRSHLPSMPFARLARAAAMIILARPYTPSSVSISRYHHFPRRGLGAGRQRLLLTALRCRRISRSPHAVSASPEICFAAGPPQRQ